MTTPRKDRVELLQGTLDLIVLRALDTMGPQHADALTARLEQVADHPLSLNQGTLYPALVRLEQRGWDQGHVAEDGDEPRCEVLRDHESRPRRAGAADEAVAPVVGSGRETAARRCLTSA